MWHIWDRLNPNRWELAAPRHLYAVRCSRYSEGYFYHPQTMFGARYCFYTCLWFCSQGLGDVYPSMQWGRPSLPGQTPPWILQARSYWNAYFLKNIEADVTRSPKRGGGGTVCSQITVSISSASVCQMFLWRFAEANVTSMLITSKSFFPLNSFCLHIRCRRVNGP